MKNKLQVESSKTGRNFGKEEKKTSELLLQTLCSSMQLAVFKTNRLSGMSAVNSATMLHAASLKQITIYRLHFLRKAKAGGD